ncbi:carbonic anhydrase [Accumulibacter sp.]|uniref:carbonic anhydrase n=1 Tax=Accumulibacter sp. TaxID=2053492 RepID=UPI0025D9FA2F|nr:carbonic anhydrase family protein [Accumulibacter sp.]MCM8596368.1 carbonic anhydrase family protein [Accumulibacter sp.]MCM8624843.1 carbonic anhydrase family protein [Accumulibacter sp.]MDS4050517.1 carbonic anhydrase family protein [Accumulibacter sp.]
MRPHLTRPTACLIAMIATAPSLAAAAWQVISAEPGKRVEIDRTSIRKEDNGKTVALGRIVLEKPIIDPKTSSSYRIVQALSRYDCNSRNYSTLKRSYFKDEGDLLREEEVKVQIEMPVRSGMLDDKLLREVCRPKADDATLAARRTADKVNSATGDLRKANEALVQQEVRRASMQTPAAADRPVAEAVASPVPRRAPRATGASVTSDTGPPPTTRTTRTRTAESGERGVNAHVQWGYEGDAGPDNWARLSPEYATCASGRRQSPIDIRDGLRVDLEPIQFSYRPSHFRVIDNGHTVQVEVDGSSLSLLGKRYELVQFHFHRPSEERIDGRASDMVAHLVHKSDDGKLAVLAVLLEKGSEHPIIQTVWNHLPLEKGEYVAPPDPTIDVAQLLPQDRSYHTYMGSLTTPPCTEGVLWLVLKQRQQISAEQLAIFARLYRNNARPIQATFSRMIKETR